MPQPSDLMLAIILLTAPVGTPENKPPFDRYPAVCQAICDRAVHLEIMDRRETSYFFANGTDWQADLDLLRKRLADLQDAPTIAEIEGFFPNRRISSDLCKFNREFRSYLEDRVLWENDRADLLWQAIEETDALFSTWDKIRDASCEYYYVTARRLAAKQALVTCCPQKLTIFEFRPPDYVPLWAFLPN